MTFYNILEDIQKTDIRQLEYTTPKPFVKWAGGKRSIINELLKKLPAQINNYYEPFIGGGALFFEIYNKVNHSYISDLNEDLIISYSVIKHHPQKLIKLLEEYSKLHNKEFYYKIRATNDLTDPIKISARFIYLMRTCFNGLYRVNSKNEFNTPMGKYKSPKICDTENILAVNQALQHTTIKHQDFTKITPNKGDFVYFDPPYHPINEDSFTKYLCKDFNKNDQIRLRDFALELIKSGINVMISNSYTEFIMKIYKNNFNINMITAPRLINCKGNKRHPVPEVLITSF